LMGDLRDADRISRTGGMAFHDRCFPT
jgi:hypothetical protein